MYCLYVKLSSSIIHLSFLGLFRRKEKLMHLLKHYEWARTDKKRSGRIHLLDFLNCK
jgi:hypothetical protein